MGKQFTAVLPNKQERFAADMSNGRAQLFLGIAKLLESVVEMPCGIEEDNGRDEYYIHAESFLLFFEKVHASGWITDPSGFVYGWACHAAGMIENITLTTKEWVCRDGSVLEIRRYLRPEDLGRP